MKIERPAKLLSIYLNSTDQWHGQSLYAAIVQVCQKQGIAGVTVLRCVEGYGGSGRLHTMRLMELTEDLPLKIEIIDLPERMEPLIATLEPMVGEGLMTLVDVQATRLLPEPRGK